MSYTVLARKYRPQKFSEVIGQEHVTRTLQNAIEQGRTAHGYIFSGHRGIGKTTVARILAMALNCRSKDHPVPEPCGICESCTEIRAGNAVDVIEIDAATNRGIDEIRELREAARYRPARDRFKIYILDEAHQITDAAFNALLKTLEEPPDHIVFMLATTQPEDIPQTIRSRCQHFSFRAVKFDAIVGHFATWSPAKISKPTTMPSPSCRSRRRLHARRALHPRSGHCLLQRTSDCRLRPQPGRRRARAHSRTGHAGCLRRARAKKSSARSTTSSAKATAPRTSPARWSGSCATPRSPKIAGKDSSLLQISSEERERVARVAELFGEEDLTRHLQIMLRTHGELGYKQEQRFHLELGLLKMAHAQKLIPIEQLLSDVAAAPAAGAQRPHRQGRRSSAAHQVRAAPSRAAAARSNYVSPFAADSARKGTPRQEDLRLPRPVRAS